MHPRSGAEPRRSLPRSGPAWTPGDRLRGLACWTYAAALRGALLAGVCRCSAAQPCVLTSTSNARAPPKSPESNGIAVRSQITGRRDRVPEWLAAGRWLPQRDYRTGSLPSQVRACWRLELVQGSRSGSRASTAGTGTDGKRGTQWSILAGAELGAQRTGLSPSDVMSARDSHEILAAVCGSRATQAGAAEVTALHSGAPDSRCCLTLQSVPQALRDPINKGL